MPIMLTMPLSPPVNARSLAGIPVKDGVVRKGFVLRSDDLSTVDELTARDLFASGIFSVIDLRSRDEVESSGRGPLFDYPLAYHHIPLIADVNEAIEQEALFDETNSGSLYIRLYEGAAREIVLALSVIAYSPGMVAFHCAGGQDRTGVLAAALLLALGAGHDDIIADYARTGENTAALLERTAPLFATLREGRATADVMARQIRRPVFSVAPIEGMLRELVDVYGDPLTPLRRAGLTDGLIGALQERGIQR